MHNKGSQTSRAAKSQRLPNIDDLTKYFFEIVEKICGQDTVQDWIDCPIGVVYIMPKGPILKNQTEKFCMIL